jgi:hypothetical protein
VTAPAATETPVYVGWRDDPEIPRFGADDPDDDADDQDAE